MHRTARAVLAAVGAALLCGQALGDEKVRLPRKGSSPGFDVRYDGSRHVPRQGNDAGPSWEERERGERRERRAREERREREERQERQVRLERVERLQRQERQERDERKATDCRKLAERARVAQEEAKQRVVVGYLAGGLLGALITSSQNDEAYKQPNVVWDEVYNNCMGQGQQGKQGQRQDEQSDGDDDDDDE